MSRLFNFVPDAPWSMVKSIAERRLLCECCILLTLELFILVKIQLFLPKHIESNSCDQ